MQAVGTDCHGGKYKRDVESFLKELSTALQCNGIVKTRTVIPVQAGDSLALAEQQVIAQKNRAFLLERPGQVKHANGYAFTCFLAYASFASRANMKKPTKGSAIT